MLYTSFKTCTAKGFTLPVGNAPALNTSKSGPPNHLNKYSPMILRRIAGAQKQKLVGFAFHYSLSRVGRRPIERNFTAGQAVTQSKGERHDWIEVRARHLRETNNQSDKRSSCGSSVGKLGDSRISVCQTLSHDARPNNCRQQEKRS
jgi:hypothetical protein